jgi:hypothetical protein
MTPNFRTLEINLRQVLAMGAINVFYRVRAAKLEEEVLPAFGRSMEERSISPLLPYLDVERVRAEVGCDPAVEVHTRGLIKKTTVARFVPSPGILLGATLSAFARDDKGHDADKLLYLLRQQTELLSDHDWERWDDLLDWGHNLPELFQGQEGPYGFISPRELPTLLEILRRLSAHLGNDEDGNRRREEVDQLCEYLSATAPTDGVLVYTG